MINFLFLFILTIACASALSLEEYLAANTSTAEETLSSIGLLNSNFHNELSTTQGSENAFNTTSYSQSSDLPLAAKIPKAKNFSLIEALQNIFKKEFSQKETFYNKSSTRFKHQRVRTRIRTALSFSQTPRVRKKPRPRKLHSRFKTQIPEDVSRKNLIANTTFHTRSSFKHRSPYQAANVTVVKKYRTRMRTRIPLILKRKNIAVAKGVSKPGQNQTSRASRRTPRTKSRTRMGHRFFATYLPKLLPKKNHSTAKNLSSIRHLQNKFIEDLSDPDAPKGTKGKMFKTKVTNTNRTTEFRGHSPVVTSMLKDLAGTNIETTESLQNGSNVNRTSQTLLNINRSAILSPSLFGVREMLDKNKTGATSPMRSLRKGPKGKSALTNSLVLYFRNLQRGLYDFDGFDPERMGVESKPMREYYPYFKLSTVCIGRSTLYNRPVVYKYLYQNVYYRKHKHRPVWIELRKQIYLQANAEECHNYTKFKTWKSYQYCAIRRNQRMEYLIPKYPLHQVGYRRSYAFDLPKD